MEMLCYTEQARSIVRRIVAAQKRMSMLHTASSFEAVGREGTRSQYSVEKRGFKVVVVAVVGEVKDMARIQVDKWVDWGRRFMSGCWVPAYLGTGSCHSELANVSKTPTTSTPYRARP